MNIAVVLRQVLDLIEPLEVASEGTSLAYDGATFVVNESDDHALEQALLLKEAHGGTVTAVALDFGDVDNTLYAAAAKGADRVVKIPWDQPAPPSPRTAAALYAEGLRPLGAELVMVGVQAHDEFQGVLPPYLAVALKLPYVGVIRGVKPAAPGAIEVCKEFPGAVMSQMRVSLPAVLGILGAEKPPRYVPVSRIRAAMKSTQLEEEAVSASVSEPPAAVERLYPPAAAERAEMLEGSVEDVAARIAGILAEKGLLK